jgi:agmatine deiminase
VKNTPIRLPAQWEPLEAVIVAFPIYYPPLWATHAAMIAAIADAGARVDVLVPSEGWAKIAAFALEHTFEVKGAHDPTRVRWIVLPTDDIWVRDYAPFIGFRPDGTRAALGMIYDPLSTYSQWRDDSMQKSYAELNAIPFQKVQFRTEGGNFWSDGAGTLIVSDDLYDRNPKLAPAAVENALHRSFAFETLIVTPKLWREETGHVDLLLKLADAGTVLVSAPTIIPNGGRLARAAAILRGARNAAGERYRVLELPTPPPYLNWGVYPIWRSYTNALTVNGRVLVPTFGIDMDARALAIYRAAMPEYEIIPISCAAAANGGGGVHCLTHEVPALPLRHE